MYSNLVKKVFIIVVFERLMVDFADNCKDQWDKLWVST